MQSTNKGTAPASTTAYAKSAVCLAIYLNAEAAASLTLGSNSSKHITSYSRAPESTTDLASVGECFATHLKTNAAAFL